MNRKIFFVVAIFILVTTKFYAQQSVKALFLGNSYVSANNLPGMVQDISTAEGHSLTFASNTPGGYTFEGHSTNSTSMLLMEEQNWDFVVLQQQSQMPSFPDAQVEQQTYPFAEVLCDSIRSKAPCAIPLFYMTWGRENGDQDNCEFFPPLCTYEGMQDLLSERYLYMAETNAAACSPVGEVWRYVRENHPEIDLYSGDGSHPSVNGTYLAACTFFVSMFNQPLLVNSEPSEMDAIYAADIRDAVNEVIIGNEAAYFLEGNLVNSMVNYEIEGTSLSLSFETSSNVSSIQLLWLDGSVFILENGEEINIDLSNVLDGTYTIEYLLMSDCGDESDDFVFDYSSVGVDESEDEIEMLVHSGQLVLRGIPQSSILTIHNTEGKVLFQKSVLKGESYIVLPEIINGMVLAKLSSDSYHLSKKMLILR